MDSTQTSTESTAATEKQETPRTEAPAPVHYEFQTPHETQSRIERVVERVVLETDAMVDRALKSWAPESLSAAEQSQMGTIQRSFHDAVRALKEKYDATLGYPQSQLRDANREPEHKAQPNEYQRMNLLNTVKGGADGTTPMSTRVKALGEYQAAAAPKDMLTVIAGLAANLNESKAGVRPVTESNFAPPLAEAALNNLSQKFSRSDAWQTEVPKQELDPDKLNADSLARAMVFGVKAQEQVIGIMEKVSRERPETREVMAASLGKVVFNRLGTRFETEQTGWPRFWLCPK